MQLHICWTEHCCAAVIKVLWFLSTGLVFWHNIFDKGISVFTGNLQSGINRNREVYLQASTSNSRVLPEQAVEILSDRPGLDTNTQPICWAKQTFTPKTGVNMPGNIYIYIYFICPLSPWSSTSTLHLHGHLLRAPRVGNEGREGQGLRQQMRDKRRVMNECYCMPQHTSPAFSFSGEERFLHISAYMSPGIVIHLKVKFHSLGVTLLALNICAAIKRNKC